jgi:methyl acetate hydrolase
MATDFEAVVDAILNRVVTSEPRVPGVVAMVTNPERNIYEGAAGMRRLDRDADMTTDTVFGIFSTTKAITGTAALQLVEEGKLDLDAPAKTYVPEIGELRVIEGFDAHGEPKLRAPKRDITTRSCCCTRLAWATISSTSNTTGSHRRRANRALSLRRKRR